MNNDLIIEKNNSKNNNFMNTTPNLMNYNKNNYDRNQNIEINKQENISDQKIHSNFSPNTNNNKPNENIDNGNQNNVQNPDDLVNLNINTLDESVGETIVINNFIICYNKILFCKIIYL